MRVAVVAKTSIDDSFDGDDFWDDSSESATSTELFGASTTKPVREKFKAGKISIDS